MKTTAIAALLLLAGSFSAHAQDQGSKAGAATDTDEAAGASQAITESAGRTANASITFYGDHTFSSDFENNNGDASVWRLGSKLEMAFPVMDQSEIGVSFRAERWGFDFNDDSGGGNGLGSTGEPWDEATNLAMLVSFRNRINDDWSWTVGGGGEAFFADGAEFSDSLTGDGFAAVTRRVNENLSIGLGVIARTRLEDDAFIAPMLILDWNINEKWRLSTSPGIGRRLVTLSYTPVEDWSFAIGAGYEAIDIRLDSDDDDKGGVGRYRRIPVGGDVSWHPSGQFAAGIFAGVHVWQEYTLDDPDGNRLGQQEADPAGFLGGYVRWTF
jgi:hypothetical protein